MSNEKDKTVVEESGVETAGTDAEADAVVERAEIAIID